MSEDPEPDYGPIYIGSEKDIMQLAFENLNAQMKSDAPEQPADCEECGKSEGTLTRCEHCLFWFCALCTGSANHDQMHFMKLRHEGRL